jgi:NAD(P)-dependent dehydrogenase (short-subunit alcohol dehydrogenase family)
MLTNKNVLITGASGGLGQPVTQALLDAGAHVFAISRSMDRHPAAASSRLQEIHASLDTLEKARETVDGLPPLDAAIHIVGGWSGGQRAEETPDSMFEKMLTVNLWTALHLFRAVVPGMRERGHGRLLAVGSKSALHPAAKSAAYNLSKAALISFVQTLAVENADRGITANIVLPGTIDTEANRQAMPHANRSTWVPPERIAALLVHLASDAGASISGAAIPIYGEPA